MAIGATEIVAGFETERDSSAYGPRIGRTVSVCGICGAVVAPGLEPVHESWHGTAAWVQVPVATTTIRMARSPWEPNAP